jgi:hypothetical protein
MKYVKSILVFIITTSIKILGWAIMIPLMYLQYLMFRAIGNNFIAPFLPNVFAFIGIFVLIFVAWKCIGWTFWKTVENLHPSFKKS